MEYRVLGNTGLRVSRLCFGGLTVGPLQANLSIETGGEIIANAFSKGVNFIDTADLYGTYKHIKRAMEIYGKKDIVIASKSYAYDEETAKESLEKALVEMSIDNIQIFLLHEQENEYTLKGHYKALEYYLKMKEQGIINAVGISTHTIRGVEVAGSMHEIDVIHPIINKEGIGIQDGNSADMLRAIKNAHNNGKGIYGMKPIGGGNLIDKAEECLDYVISQDSLDSIAVGMQSLEEVQYNVLKFSDYPIPDELKLRISTKKRNLLIDFWCQQCANCVKNCGHGALSIGEKGIVVDRNKCVLCGYCSRYCPEFCIKII